MSLLLAALTTLFAGGTWADGIVWEAPEARDLIVQKGQEAWLEWKDGRERLVIAVRPKDVSPHLAWILPVPAPASSIQLALVDKLPDWKGEEARVGAHLAISFIAVLAYFCFCLLVYGWSSEGGIVFIVVALLMGTCIGPGPERPHLADMEVSASGRVELGGLASEIVDAPSLEALERYLSDKSGRLPEPARAILKEQIQKGASFIVSWAKEPKIGRSLAVNIEFPAAKAFYPVRLTAAYGEAKLAVDLRVRGWQRPDPPVMDSPSTRVGYYYDSASGQAHTRVLFQDRARELAQDWTFVPRSWAPDLWAAAMAAAHPVLANLLLLLLSSLAGGLLVGWIAFPDWRTLAGLRPEDVPKDPSPASGPAWGWQHLSSIGLIAVGTAWLAYSEMESGLFICWALSAAGLAWFHRARGHPWSYAAGSCLLAVWPIVGPLLGLFLKPRPPEAIAARTRWSRVAAGSALACLALNIAIGVWLLRLWPLERATASLEYSGRGFAGLIRKSSEGATRGNLGAIRAAVDRYHDAMQGRTPADLAALTAGGKYLPSIPPAKPANYHNDSSQILTLTGAQYAADWSDDAGGWAYVASGPSSGTVLVNCVHTDTRGTFWSAY